MKKRLSCYDMLAFASILILLIGLVCTDAVQKVLEVSDVSFLYNRVKNLRTCIFNGDFIGMFFYKDMQNWGYGSSFFYGYLTLIPFIFIKSFKIFWKIFYIVSLLTMYFGVRCLFKRFVKRYDLLAFLFITCYNSLICFMSLSTYLNFYAIGLSFFFIAFCVDFFRDKKSFIPASFMFYLVLNTHMLTASLSFLACVFTCIYYLDKSQFKGYIKFFLITLSLCSFYIVNFIYHTSGGVLNTQAGRKYFVDMCLNDSKSYMFTFRGFSDILGVGFLGKNLGLMTMSIVSAVTLIYLLKKHRPSDKNLIVLIFCIISIVLSTYPIWGYLYKTFGIVYQFPSRFSFYILFLLILIGFRHLDSHKILRNILILDSLLAVAWCSLVMTPNDASSFSSYDYNVSNSIGQGEYLQKDFDFNIFSGEPKVVDTNKFEYPYELVQKYTIIDMSRNRSDNTVITIPKLWYKGYKAYTFESNKQLKQLKVTKGYSQQVQIDVGNYNGKVIVYYTTTWWLYLWEICSYLYLLGVLIYYGYKQRDSIKLQGISLRQYYKESSFRLHR